jgi:hypothetical protein
MGMVVDRLGRLAVVPSAGMPLEDSRLPHSVGIQAIILLVVPAQAELALERPLLQALSVVLVTAS